MVYQTTRQPAFAPRSPPKGIRRCGGRNIKRRKLRKQRGCTTSTEQPVSPLSIVGGRENYQARPLQYLELVCPRRPAWRHLRLSRHSLSVAKRVHAEQIDWLHAPS